MDTQGGSSTGDTQENPFIRRSKIQRSPNSAQGSQSSPTDITRGTQIVHEKRPRTQEDEEYPVLKKQQLQMTPPRGEPNEGDPESPKVLPKSAHIEGLELTTKISLMAKNCLKNPKAYMTTQKSKELADLAEALADILSGLYRENIEVKAKLEERKDILNEFRKFRKESPPMGTYSQALQSAPETIQNPRNKAGALPLANKGYTMLIYPKDDSTSSEGMRDLIKEKINPGQQKLKVHRLSKIRNGGVALEVGNEVEASVVKDILREKANIRIPTKRRPRITLFGISRSKNEGELVQEIHSQNFDEMNLEEFRANFTPRFRTGPKDSSTVNWVCECDPGIFKKMMGKRKVFLNWESIRVSEHLLPTRCFRCQKYGHLAKDCQAAKEICGHCSGEGHDRLNCPLTRLPPVCANCPKGRANHSVHGKACPSYTKEVARMTTNIDYGD